MHPTLYSTKSAANSLTYIDHLTKLFSKFLSIFYFFAWSKNCIKFAFTAMQYFCACFCTFKFIYKHTQFNLFLLSVSYVLQIMLHPRFHLPTLVRVVLAVFVVSVRKQSQL